LTARVPVRALADFCRGVLVNVGVPAADASVTTEVIMQAERFGVSSHGLVRLPHYVSRILQGSINPHPQVQVATQENGTALVDGDNGLGHVVSYFAMKKAIELGKQGPSFVGVRRSSHFGFAGYYALMAAKEGMIGFSFTHTDVILAPYGGREPRLGSNPFAVAIPCDGPHPILLDISTSYVAWGKIIVARERGESINPEWAIDSEGNPTSNPHEARVLMPFGGHKGYGLAVLVDVFCAVLSGAAYADLVYPKSADGKPLPANLGHFFGAWRIEAFRPAAEFKAAMDDLQRRLKGSPRAEGQNRIYIHGEKEYENAERNLKEGLAVNPKVVADLRALAAELSVKFDLE
jgi:L-2-hydroxycarboxylate dehydrogenase (NAD+)